MSDNVALTEKDQKSLREVEELGYDVRVTGEDGKVQVMMQDQTRGIDVTGEGNTFDKALRNAAVEMMKKTDAVEKAKAEAAQDEKKYRRWI